MGTMKLFFQADVATNLKTIQQQFNRDLFLKLKPPFMTLNLKRFDGCEKGHEVHLELGLPGFLQSWISTITEAHQEPHRWVFVDEGTELPFPLKRWRHEHQVVELAPQHSRIIDSIEFDCGNPALNALMFGPLWLSFSVRPAIYKKAFGSVDK